MINIGEKIEMTKMTTALADRLITSKNPSVIVTTLGETAIVIFTSRDRWSVYTQCKMVLDRGDIAEVHPLAD